MLLFLIIDRLRKPNTRLGGFMVENKLADSAINRPRVSCEMWDAGIDHPLFWRTDLVNFKGIF